MSGLRSLTAAAVALVSVSVLGSVTGACGQIASDGTGGDGGGASSSSGASGSGGVGASSGSSGNPGGPGGPGLPDIDQPLVPASKVDVLLVVDNSASMSDKSSVLSKSLGTLLRGVAKRAPDLHVGVITTSLGSMGGDVCDAANPETNGRSHLRTTDANGADVLGGSQGVLSFTAGGDVEAFVNTASSIVSGVGQTGCGLEAQLEATYRFLAEPDPWDQVTLDANNQADLGEGVDRDVLVQRKAFLRPDSALAIVLLTDEDDSAADPLSVQGQGWAFEAKSFPGSRVTRGDAAQGTTAPRSSVVCSIDPGTADCTSCGFQSLCDPQTDACKKLKVDANCMTPGISGKSGDGYNGYYGPTDDALNIRFFRMKERFGIDPQFPISRYVDAFTKSVVPNRKSEHVTTVSGSRRDIAPYTGTATCTNPIFATTLPSQPGDELCSLARGPRSRELVLFTVIGGVPPMLAADSPNWSAIVGANPDAFDFTGIDPHMIQSSTPRQGLASPSTTPGDNGADPIHGREYNTNKSDLQYACTFALPTPRVCQPNDASCDCTDASNAPLCSATPNEQIRAKAYPTIRPLRVARGLGDRGVIGSICDTSYDTTMSRLLSRLDARLK